jgi:serine/threonine-protein kinase
MANSTDLQIGVSPGDVLAGKYRVEHVLGVGGMGVVVAAHHIQLDERVALKFLLPEALANPAALSRFEREARAAVKIKSEHVARVTDVGRLESGVPYMVMEYLDGRDLSSWLANSGPLGVEQAVDFILQACEAIAEAHALGIVHRDLKPANLFCIRRPDGQLSIKVLDFGISKVTTVGAAAHEMTRTSAMVGSPLYMSPEQMQSSKGVDVRTDIWSLGLIFFELVAGRTPFQADTVTELAIKVATQPAPPLRAFRSDVPPVLEAVIDICLQKERDQRYQTVGDFAIALAGFASLRGRASVDRVLGTLRTSNPPAPSGGPSSPTYLRAEGGTPASWGHSERPPKPHRYAVVAVASLAVLLVVSGGAAILFRPGGTPSPPAATTEQVGPAAPLPPPVETLATVSTALPEPPIPSAQPQQVSPSPSQRARHGGPPAKTATSALPSATPPLVAPSAKANCDPPYYFDSTGTRFFKKECL